MYFVMGAVAIVLFYGVLYVVVRVAVRHTIQEIEKDRDREDNPDIYLSDIAQMSCPECHKKHDIDYPKCPHCKHSY